MCQSTDIWFSEVICCFIMGSLLKGTYLTCHALQHSKWKLMLVNPISLAHCSQRCDIQHTVPLRTIYHTGSKQDACLIYIMRLNWLIVGQLGESVHVS